MNNNRRQIDHKYKGFLIRPTYKDDWTLELISDDIEKCERFYDEQEHYFRTLKEAKEWIKENGEELLKNYKDIQNQD